MQKIAVSIVFFILMAGCVLESDPEVILESETMSGTAPFTPEFVYGCNDIDDNLILCELKSDGKTIFSQRSHPDSILPITYTEQGAHLLEINATDAEGRTTYKKIIFHVTESPALENQPPQVILESTVTEGRAPFQPPFRFNCIDPENELALCELKSDGKTIFSGSTLPDTIASIVYKDTGKHDMEVRAVDKQGLTSYANITFKVTPPRESPTKFMNIYTGGFPPTVDKSYKNAIWEATRYWTERDNIEFKEVTEDESHDIFVNWIKEYGGLHVGLARGDTINIGLGDSNCYGKWRPYTYRTISNIAKHEVGHVLGYDHTTDENDIMYPTVNEGKGIQYSTDVDETVYAPEGWFFYYPICTTRNQTEYLFEVTSDKPLNVYVVPSESDVRKGETDLDYSQYAYNGCVAENVYTFSKKCVVDSEAHLVLVNNIEKGTATISIKATEQE